jgi:biopolymer transport protein ExbB/TolQ
MTETFWVAIIVLFTSVGSPILLAHLTSRRHRRERLEDYERQDRVARRVAEAAERLTKRQDQTAIKAAEAAELLLAANERVAATAGVVNDKLDIIHTLVNSNMSAAMQAELDALETSVAMMTEVIDLKKAAGREPTQDALVALKSARAKVRESKVALADRTTQSELIEAQEKEQKQ